MKYVLLFAALLFVFTARSQNTTTSIFCVQVNCPITITAPTDSALLFGAANITAPDAISTYSWKQVSGPAAAVLSVPSASQTMARKLQVGTYVFSLTVTTKNGASNTVATDSVTVNPAPPAPRKVKSIVTQIVGGVLVTTITYDDGTTQ